MLFQGSSFFLIATKVQSHAENPSPQTAKLPEEKLVLQLHNLKISYAFKNLHKLRAR